MTYYFYSKTDSEKEKIDKVNCDSIEEALEYFALKKHLSIEKFKKLFEIYYE